MVEVENPSFNITVGFAVIVVVASEGAPGVTTKVLLVPVSEPEVLVAVIEQVPRLEIETVVEERTPATKLAVVP